MTASEREQLIRSLRFQIESQVRAGDIGVMEQILDSHPELQADLEAALDLIYVEITTREELGQPADARELKLRFPHWIDRIERLLAVHRALQLESSGRAGETRGGDRDTDVDLFGPHHERTPQCIAQYELLEEIGRGGMGVVFRARQPELNRIVALKLIREVFGSGDSGRRLVHEAKTVARLDHPQIVRVYDAGYDDRTPFICLEYVEGGSLADKLSQSTLDAKTACKMLHLLASAMQYAHTQGVIHRDLKPANVLLDSSGQPKIADFGLAKSIWEQPASDHMERLTQTGAILGSLCYMSPEQVSGQDERIGVTTDVYGLGTILYEMLVGRPPFVRESPLDTAHDIQFREAVSPRTFVPNLPRDVETICLKCLEKNPARRYASAAELAGDLERFLTGQPLSARPVGTLTRAVKWVRRRPARAAILTSLVALPLAYGLLQKKYANEISAVVTKLDATLASETAAREQADRHFWRAFDSVAKVQRKLASAGLKHEPRMQQARLDVVDDAIEIIEELGDERPDEARVQSERAQLLKLRGQILLELGRKEDSLQAFTSSVATYGVLREQSPADTQLRHSAAAALAGKAETLKWLLELESAGEAYADAARELRILADLETGDFNLQNDLVQSLSGWAAVLIDSGQSDKAADVLREANKRAADNTDRWTEEPRCHSVRAQILWALGRVAREESDFETSESFAVQAITSFERALELAPGDRTYQNFLVEVGLFHANQLQSLREFESARIPLQRSQQLLDELQGRYPAISRYRELRISVIRELSLLEVNLGNESQAVELAEQAAELRRDVLQQNPADKRSAFEFAGSLANLANRLVVTESLGASRLERAESYAREALTIPKDYSIEAVEAKPLMRFARYNLVLALSRQNRIQNARDELDELARETSSNPLDLRFLADGWSELLAAVLRTGEEHLREEVTDRTLHELERAIEAGYRDVAELQNTEVLEPLRADPRFQSLLSQARDR